MDLWILRFFLQKNFFQKWPRINHSTSTRVTKSYFGRKNYGKILIQRFFTIKIQNFTKKNGKKTKLEKKNEKIQL